MISDQCIYVQEHCNEYAFLVVRVTNIQFQHGTTRDLFISCLGDKW